VTARAVEDFPIRVQKLKHRYNSPMIIMEIHLEETQCNLHKEIAIRLTPSIISSSTMTLSMKKSLSHSEIVLSGYICVYSNEYLFKCNLKIYHAMAIILLNAWYNLFNFI